MAIQQSINQLLGQAVIGAGLGKTVRQQKEALIQQEEAEKRRQEEFEYNKPENVKARRIQELESMVPGLVKKQQEREKAFSEVGYPIEEAQILSLGKEFDTELGVYNELYDLTQNPEYLASYAQNYNMREMFQKELTDRKLAEQLKQQQEADQLKKQEEYEAKKLAEEEKKKAEAEKLDAKSTKFAGDLINQVQREARAERRDWRLSAFNQIETRDAFDDFLQKLQDDMWNAGGNK